MRMRLLVVAIVASAAAAACGSKQPGGSTDHCDRIPAGTKLTPEVERGDGIRDGEYVVDGVRRWGITFGASSDGSIVWMVETPTQIRIGYTRNSWCGGAARPDTAIAVQVPSTGKPIVAEQCGGHSSCEPNVP